MYILFYRLIHILSERGMFMEDNKNNFFILLKGLFLAYVITLVLIIIYAMVLAFTKVPESTMPVCTIVISLISVTISSSLMVSRIKEKGLFNGALIGLLYIGSLYLISSVFDTGFGVSGFSLIMILISILAGCIGGITGVNLSKR
jgi:putative membrane protein (TIGR04086 family)